MAADTTTTAAADPGVIVTPIPGWALVALLAVAALALWLVTFDNGQLTSVLVEGRPVHPRVLPRRAPPPRRALSLIAARDQLPNSRGSTVFARFDFTRPRTIVLVALLIGVLAGLGGAVFHTVATEPRVDDAIAIEEAAAEADHAMAGGESDSGEEEVSVSRTDQKGAGLFARLRADRRGLRPVPRHHLDVAAHHHRRSVPAGRRVGHGPGGRHHRGAVAQVPAQPAGRRRPRLGGRARAAVRAAHRARRAAARRARPPVVAPPARRAGPTTAGSRPSWPWGWRRSPCCSRRCRPRPTRSACRPTWCGSSGSTR